MGQPLYELDLTNRLRYALGKILSASFRLGSQITAQRPDAQEPSPVHLLEEGCNKHQGYDGHQF